MQIELESFDSHDADFTCESIEPVDDPGGPEILHQINAIIGWADLRVRFLPRIFGQSQ